MDHATPGSLEPSPGSIDEDVIAESGPRVRWLLVQRYEQAYQVAQDQIDAAGAVGRPVDPRFLEIQIRILREETGLYRLSKPPAQTDEPEDPTGGVDRAAVVLAQLAELEARVQGTGGPAAEADAGA